MYKWDAWDIFVVIASVIVLTTAYLRLDYWYEKRQEIAWKLKMTSLLDEAKEKAGKNPIPVPKVSSYLQKFPDGMIHLFTRQGNGKYVENHEFFDPYKNVWRTKEKTAEK